MSRHHRVQDRFLCSQGSQFNTMLRCKQQRYVPIWMILICVIVKCNTEGTTSEEVTSADGVPTCVVRTGARYHMQGNWEETTGFSEEPCLTWKYFDKFGCCAQKIGTNQEYCNGFLTPERVVHELLLAFSGKRVTLMGDSLTRQIFGALIMMINSTGVELEPVLTSLPQNTLINSTRIYIPSINATFRFAAVFSFAAVQGSELKSLEQKISEKKFSMKHSKVSAFIKHSDVVICNIGQHFSQDQAFQEREMKYVQQVAKKESQARVNRGETPLCWLWRHTLPQHFATAKGTGDWNDKVRGATKCSPLQTTWAHHSNTLMNRVRESDRNSDAVFPTAVIDTDDLLTDAQAFHSPRTDLGFADCTHYCFSNAVFGPIAMLHAKAIQSVCPA
eukprot:m.261496 g.261496  ORF g.261496 m.261496 type:complete len:389 (-) comp19697_c0_seq3:3083-4249(-)